MKKIVLLIAALILLDAFFIKQRSDIKAFEPDTNDVYLEYESGKENFTVTSGTITKTLPPRSERSIEEDHNLGSGGTYAWLCIIEFETNDGRKVTDRFFPYDTDNDYVGKTVDVAYYIMPDIGEAVIAGRTEYIPDTFSLRRNMIKIVVVTTAAVGASVFLFISKRKKLQ